MPVPKPATPDDAATPGAETRVVGDDTRIERPPTPTPEPPEPVEPMPARDQAGTADTGEIQETPSQAEESDQLPEASEPPGVVIVAADDSLRLPEASVPAHTIEEAEFEDAVPPRGRNTPPPSYYDDDDDIPELPGRGWSPGRWLIIITVVGGAALIAANFDQVLSLLGLGAPAESTQDSVAEGDKAMAAEHLQAYQTAITHYALALEAGTENEGALFAKLSSAHALAAQAIRDGEDRAEGDTTMQRHVKAALDYAEQALMTDPEGLNARLREADALRLRGDAKAARESLERARLMPFSRTAEFYRIDALLTAEERGDTLAAASRSAREAAQAAPDNPRYRLLVARAELASGDLTRARSDVEQVLAANPEHPAATVLLAEIEEAASDAPTEIVDDGGVAADTTDEVEVEGVKPDSPANVVPPPAELPADASDAAPKDTTTKDEVDAPSKAETEPASPRPPKVTAKPEPSAPARKKSPAYDEYDRLAEAAGSDSFVDGRPPIRDFGWYMREGEAALAGNDYTRARAFFDSALEARPGSGDATDALGRLALESGEAEQAVRYFRSAAQRGHPDGYYNLGRAYERLDQSDEAVSAYYTYLKRRPSGVHVPAARAAIKKLEPRVKLPDPEAPGEAPDTPTEAPNGPIEEPETTTP
ncbi:MAG: tetratricopeptide repeat protein [Polyangiales bacterium]